MSNCPKCYEEMADGKCIWCEEKERFAEFAKSCGLTRFPRPDGERYLYNTDCGSAGKKSENEDFADELWNALVKAKGGDSSLLLP